MIQDLQKTLSGNAWQKIGIKHHHGIVVPLFSLLSDLSCGVGEYLDLIPMLPWLKSCGFDIIQLLPLNDLGRDSSPYSALSAFALNPLLLSLAQLPYLRQAPSFKIHSSKVEYEKVALFKESFLRTYYSQNYSKFSKTPAFIHFLETQGWLRPFALFKTLKILTNWQPWETWPSEWKNITNSTFKHLFEKYAEEVFYHIFVQFLCYEQLKLVKNMAKNYQVFLMGDIPILLNRESADVWYHPEFFHMDYTAGAPPDMFSVNGQNWGFPLYNWKELASKNYAWWRNRISYASEFYDLYRLDHIVGFFRIWGIPLGKSGEEGSYFPPHIDQWLPQGITILKILQETSSTMLPIGEDLGVIPHEVRQVLKDQGICGTKVMRWERHWESTSDFVNTKTYIPESLTTVSTHDSETLYQWWHNQPEEAYRYASSKGWKYEKELSSDYAKLILLESHQSSSLFHVNLLQEYLRLVPHLSWPSMDEERINVPGTVSPSNWSYKYKYSVDEIVKNNELSDILKSFASVQIY